MKRYKKRITSAALAALMLCTNVGGPAPAYGAQAAVDVDETMYVNLDYYGKTSKVNVVKSCSLNGNTAFTDYGTYENVTNMSDETQPQLGDGTVTWNLPADRSGRFYYQCTLGNDQVTLPWDFNVSYKLNGVPTNADQLAGASGLVEINVKADPNEGARDYYKNNMILMVAVPVDMSKCYSVEAEGSQTQNLGETTAVVFTALPGEEGDYTVRIGTDSFESIGVVMAMAPGTVEDLEHVKDLKEAKDTWQDAGDQLYDSLEQMAKSVEGMRDGVNSVKEGAEAAERARQTWSGSKDQILAGNDQTLAALTAMSGQMEAMVPHLQTAKESAEVVHQGMNNIVDTLGEMQDPLRKLHTRLKNIENDMDSLSTELPEIQKLMLQVIELDAKFQYNEQSILMEQQQMQDAFLSIDELYFDEDAEEPEENETPVKAQTGSESGGTEKGSGGTDSGSNSGPSANTPAPDPADTSAPDPADTSAPDPADTSTSDPADTSASDPADTSASDPADTSAPDPADTSAPDPADTSAPDPADTSATDPADTPASDTSAAPSLSLGQAAALQASVIRHSVPLVGAGLPPETVYAMFAKKTASLTELAGQSSRLVSTMSSMTGDTADAAKYTRELIDNLDFLIEDITALNDSLDVYYPDLQDALTDSKELVNRTTEALNSGISTMSILQNTLKNSSDDFDAAARDSLRGSMELLDQSLSVLDSTTSMREAGRTMKNTLDNELDKFDTDNRFLFMDPTAPKVSFTSDKNKEPKTLQIVLRTDEISLDDDQNKPMDVEQEKESVSPLRRMWNVLVKMWHAIIDIFRER